MREAEAGSSKGRGRGEEALEEEQSWGTLERGWVLGLKAPLRDSAWGSPRDKLGLEALPSLQGPSVCKADDIFEPEI